MVLSLPGDKTLGPIALVIFSPNNSTAFAVKGIDDSLREKQAGHEVNGQTT
jgi:hypothetical protein